MGPPLLKCGPLFSRITAMAEEYAHGRSDALTAFEIRIKGFSQRILRTLCQKGFSPKQSLRMVIEKETKAEFQEITWAVTEAILFIEISRRYAHCRPKSNKIIRLRRTNTASFPGLR